MRVLIFMTSPPFSKTFVSPDVRPGRRIECLDDVDCMYFSDIDLDLD